MKGRPLTAAEIADQLAKPLRCVATPFSRTADPVGGIGERFEILRSNYHVAYAARVAPGLFDLKLSTWSPVFCDRLSDDAAPRKQVRVREAFVLDELVDEALELERSTLATLEAAS